MVIWNPNSEHPNLKPETENPDLKFLFSKNPNLKSKFWNPNFGYFNSEMLILETPIWNQMSGTLISNQNFEIWKPNFGTLIGIHK